MFLCVGIWRCGGCNTQEMALLPELLLQIFFKLVNMMGWGNGSGQKGVFVCMGWVGGEEWACLCLCKHVCEWGDCFWPSCSSKRPYVLLSASGTLGLAAEPRNKAVSSFPGRRVNKCLSQSPWPMGGGGKRGVRYAHNSAVWKRQILQHIYVTCFGHIAVFIQFIRLF